LYAFLISLSDFKCILFFPPTNGIIQQYYGKISLKIINIEVES
jgi:hypothetical protein